MEHTRVLIKPFYFFPPQPHNPLTNPVIPAPAAFLVSIFSAKDGNMAWFKAKSKNKGLQATADMFGGSFITFGLPDVRDGSSINSSRR